MSKRLQVVMSEAEIKGFERSARASGLSLSEWARVAMRNARDAEPARSPDRKLAAIRAAAHHRFPAPDIDQMLAEIEMGYGQDAGG